MGGNSFAQALSQHSLPWLGTHANFQLVGCAGEWVPLAGRACMLKLMDCVYCRYTAKTQVHRCTLPSMRGRN